MIVGETPITGVFELLAPRRTDSRGAFQRTFCGESLRALGLDAHVEQCNLSVTTHAGTVRGMHFQLPPFAETKTVRCVRGRCFDVVVDLRAGSPTLMRWWSVVLDADRGNAVLIPKGCAHGFQSLDHDTCLVYTHSTSHHPDAERGLSPLDPRLSIAWPLPVSNLSERDSSFPPISDSFPGLVP